MKKTKPTIALRVYADREKLMADFKRMVQASDDIEGRTVIGHSEIRFDDGGRILFKLDDVSQVAGYRPTTVYFDEMVSAKTKEFLAMRGIK